MCKFFVSIYFRKEWLKIKDCETCNGKGVIICYSCSGTGFFNEYTEEKCDRCDGQGKIICPDCEGLGLKK
jgi:DnaJ-class molecular chaperone